MRRKRLVLAGAEWGIHCRDGDAGEFLETRALNDGGRPPAHVPAGASYPAEATRRPANQYPRYPAATQTNYRNGRRRT